MAPAIESSAYLTGVPAPQVSVGRSVVPDRMGGVPMLWSSGQGGFFRLFTVGGEMDPWNERHAAVRTALLKRITDL